jgi:hypothetical protein
MMHSCFKESSGCSIPPYLIKLKVRLIGKKEEKGQNKFSLVLTVTRWGSGRSVGFHCSFGCRRKIKESQFTGRCQE